MFRKQTKKLLWVGFGGLLLLMGVLGVSAVSFLNRIDRRHELLRRDFVARDRTIEALRSDVYLSGTYIRDFLLDATPEERAQHARAYQAVRARIQAEVTQYGAYLRPEENQPFQTLKTEIDSYLETLNEVFEWSQQQRREMANSFIQNQLLPRRMGMVGLADHISDLNGKRMEAGSRETSELFSQFRLKLILLVTLTLAVGAVLAGLSLRRMLQLEKESQARFAEVERARQELRELSARELAAQETERRKIARELHDEVGQALWAMSLAIDNLTAALKRGDADEGVKQLGRMREMCDQNMRVVRNMSLLLRPSMLDDLGLLPALKWLAREVSRTSELLVDVTAGELPETVPDEYKTCVYRVAQEALRNASRHSGATHARIHLLASGNKLLMSIQDDGAGFDPSREKGLGLLGMEERVHRAGGVFSVDSAPGRGTIVGIELPLEIAGHPAHAVSSPLEVPAEAS